MAERFFRTLGLTIVNEARLLSRDPVSLLMLVIAPVVIMTVAGYSLGALYGAHPRAVDVALVDHDDGTVADALVAAVPDDVPLRLARAPDLAAVRARLEDQGTAPLAVEVPAGTRAALAAGRDARLVLWVDPARRLEVNALELALARVMRRAAVHARRDATRELARHARELRHALADLERGIARERRRARAAAVADARDGFATLRARVEEALAKSRRDVEATLRRAEQDTLAGVRSEIAIRGAALERVATALRALDATRPAFERWLTDLRARAGRHADDIPPPPAFPAMPADADVALLARPLAIAPADVRLPALDVASLVADFGDDLARRAAGATVATENDALAAVRTRLAAAPAAVLPGTLDAAERPAVDGASVRVNAFDQYVPGFGVTFLLIGMMLGISLTLFDERDWGTLERVRAGGASLPGILIGKVVGRTVVGVFQMVVLFGVGWLLFDVTLGHTPSALFLPTISMAFAGAALGLVIPSLAPEHESVMPLGTMTSLALAAIGGCWWPLDFEPAWMRTFAQWLPTTWTMQAYNDLMIRGAPASAALVPALVTAAIGVVVLAIGVAAAMRTRPARG